MGLDTLELVLEVEEAFGVQIPDERAATIVTVGDLHDVLVEHLAKIPRESHICLSAATFYLIRRAVHDVLGRHVPIRPQDQTDVILPEDRRAEIWQALASHLQLRWPSLSRPIWLVWILSVTVAAASGAIACLAYATAGTVIAAVAGIGSAIVLTMVSAMGTKSLATVPRLPIATFRGLTHNVLALNFATLAARYRAWTSADIWRALSVLLVDQLGVRAELITRDAHIVRDLAAE